MSPPSERDATDLSAAADTEQTIGRSKIRYKTVRDMRAKTG